jgi:FKBP-type peptidyl-prolyl cis-trans isomerase SlyD
MCRAPRWLAGLALVACVLAPLAPASAEDAKTKATEAPATKATKKVVADGATVSIEYTLTLDDGSQVDSNVGGEPLVYHQGGEQILPALEQALAGMAVDESKKVTITAEQGYGPVDPSLLEEVDANMVPEDGRTAGTQLVSEDASGNRRLVRVHEVKGDRIVLDFNHPLAGKTLHFDVKIVGIE